MHGRMKWRPGDWDPHALILPRRKMTARSYSWIIWKTVRVDEMEELTLKQTQRDHGSVTSTSTQEEKISSQPQRPGPWLLGCSGEEPGHQTR